MKKKHITWQWLSAAIISLLVFSAPAFAGSLNPSAAPGPTMKTLDQAPAKDEVIPPWSQTLPASERFKLVLGDTAVLDRETGLVWNRDPNPPDSNWYNGQDFCMNNVIGNRRGWRLPTIQELLSLIDPSQVNTTALPPGWDNFFFPPGAPFAWPYWSATTSTQDASEALQIFFYNSSNFPNRIYRTPKMFGGRPWCVRGGQGVDAQ